MLKVSTSVFKKNFTQPCIEYVEKRKKIRAEFLRPDVIVNFFKEQYTLFFIYFPGRNTRLLHVFCNNAYPEVPGAPALPAD